MVGKEKLKNKTLQSWNKLAGRKEKHHETIIRSSETQSKPKFKNLMYGMSRMDWKYIHVSCMLISIFVSIHIRGFHTFHVVQQKLLEHFKKNQKVFYFEKKTFFIIFSNSETQAETYTANFQLKTIWCRRVRNLGGGGHTIGIRLELDSKYAFKLCS